MKILVLNCGSSSVKYQLIEMENRLCLAKGMVSRIGMRGAVLNHKPHDREETIITGEILDHIMAIEFVISILLSPNHGVIASKEEIGAVGHRVVHGGESFTESCLVTLEVMKELRKLIELAPLHNPHNIRGIYAAQANLPDIPNVAVFDTALHHKMPEHAYLYGLPYVLYNKYKIRRYGFHGMSHKYVALRTAALIDKPFKELKLVTCHLGNGASATAFKDGISIDTSMGFTPLEGLMMGTRSGDVDPAVILHIMSRQELSLHEAATLLNKHSGLVGVTGISSDMREIIKEMNNDSKKAKLAFDMYCYRIKKYIGAYAAAMAGLDAITFTAGIGENSPDVRKSALAGLEFLGVKIDNKKNKKVDGKETFISTKDSRVKIAVVPTNEELVIAIDTYEIVSREKPKT